MRGSSSPSPVAVGLWPFDHFGTNLGLWSLASALFLVGIGLGVCFATVSAVALGDANADEASGSFSSIRQLASAIGSVAVTSILFQSATCGLAHAMKASLLAVPPPH